MWYSFGRGATEGLVTIAAKPKRLFYLHFPGLLTKDGWPLVASAHDQARKSLMVSQLQVTPRSASNKWTFLRLRSNLEQSQIAREMKAGGERWQL
jgi:hypothetical protein